MRTFFEQFIQNTHGSDTKAVTVLDGAHIGERAVLSGNGICWKSEENGFFATHEQQVLEKCGRKNGQVQIEGVRLFSEGMAYNKKMVICGGGHVGIAVARLALMTEFDVTVLEDRPKFAETARRIGVQRVICDSFENGLKQIPGDKDTYFVIVTRGHRFDQTCLEIAMEKPHAYIGMMGSHVRVARMKESLVEQGIAREQIDAVHTPVGLRIGAETPEEIAVSILAEIIQVKNQEQHIGGYNENILAGVKRAEEMGLQKTLATIVGRRGSTPRKEGTKMLVFEDGTCVETIGGGCVEAEVIRSAILLMRENKERSKLIHVDMTGQTAEEEGMVCGGVVDILLEIV